MFFRLRIPLLTSIVVLIATIVGVMMARGQLNRTVAKQARIAVERAQGAFPSLDLLRGIDLTSETNRMAHEDEFLDLFSKGGAAQIRPAAFAAISVRSERLDKAGKKPDLVAVIGPQGRVVSRDLNINAMYDEDWKAKFPAVEKALAGSAVKDVWDFEGRMYHVAIAPIRNRQGQIAGALIVGYVASSKDAAGDRDKVGAEVGYFLNGKMQASSLRTSGGESAKEKALAAQLFEDKKLAGPALAGELTKPFDVVIDGERFLAAAGPLAGNATKSAAGFVVLTSVAAIEEPLSGAVTWIFFVGVIGILATLAAAVLTSLRFINPLDTIERGVADVINGNRDVTFESDSPDVEGLANGLNVMMARLLGRPDPSDDDLGDQNEGGGGSANELAVAVDPVATGQHTSPENAALAVEPEEQYLRRVFQEYVDSRTQTGEGVESTLTYESFAAKLRGNEAQLKRKYNSKAVRFKVVVKNGQTTLKPVPIT